jgi:hypothetical protein
MTIYLYIKRHSVTGLKYFGKTTKSDPYKYMGSGKYWIDHIKKHGKEYIQTTHLWGFDGQEMCTDFALTFSKNNNIVESSEWANLKEENGLDGAVKGSNLSAETKAKMSLVGKGKTLSKEHKAKISLAKKGRIRSAEHTAKLSLANKGKTRSDETRAKMSLAAKNRPKSIQLGIVR